MILISRYAPLFTVIFLLQTHLIAQPMQQMEGNPAMAAPMGNVTVQGSVINGTTSQPIAPEEIALLRPAGGMQVLQTIKPGQVNFRFDPVEMKGPLLVRATFRGEAFIQMIPPTQNAGRPQTIRVFEPGATSSDIVVTAGIQVTKLKDKLHISKVFAIENKSNPPRSLAAGEMKIFIPDGVENFSAQLQHEGSMPLPNSISAEGTVQKGIRPGNAEISLEYDLPGHELTDKPPTMTSGGQQKHSFLILVFRPADATPEITGGEMSQVQIPNLGTALRIGFTEPKVKLDFSAGGFMVLNPMQADVNALFDESWKTGLTLLFMVMILFAGVSLISSSGIRIVKKQNR